MSRLKQNVISNLAGNAWSSIMSLLFVPIYIHYLGMEAWGLIGFFVTLQNLLALADMGLSTTLNREFARGSEAEGEAERRRDLLRTLEIVYWCVAIAGGAAVAAGAPLLAAKWLHVQHLSAAMARQSIMLMGLVLALQLPLALYSGGLLGLQQQLRLNVINIVMWTLRGGTTVAVVALVEPTPLAWFLCQVVAAALHTTVVAVALRRALGPSNVPARFRRQLLAGIWRFSAGVIGITVTATLLTQIDKIVLSKILSLEAFGYYALASVVAGALYRIITPLFVAFFPRLTELVAKGDIESLRTVYHAGSQLLAVFVIPAAATIAFFSRELIFVWTRNAVTADRVHVIVTLLVIGTALNGLMNIPYALQLAHGWTRLGFYTNLIACIVLVPPMFWLAIRWGAIGAAAVWVALNVGYVTINVSVMHRRLLPGEQRRWYTQDVGRPLAGGVLIPLLARFVFPVTAGWMVQVFCLGAILSCAVAAAALCAPSTRQNVQALFANVILPALRRTAA